MRRLVVCVCVVCVVASAAAQGPATPPRVLMVADELSLQFRSTPRVRDQMWHLLRVLKQSGDRAAIVSTGRSQVAVPLSANWDTLDAAVRKILGEALSPEIIGNATSTSDDGDELRRRAAAASSVVAKALRSIASGPGSVLVVYFTEGYPSFVPEPGEFVQEAIRTNAAIYAVDPRGFSEADKQVDAKAWAAYLTATRGSVRTMARGITGNTIFTRHEFEAALSSLAMRRPSID